MTMKTKKTLLPLVSRLHPLLSFLLKCCKGKRSIAKAKPSSSKRSKPNDDDDDDDGKSICFFVVAFHFSTADDDDEDDFEDEIDASELEALDTSNIIPRSRRQAALASGLARSAPPATKPAPAASAATSSSGSSRKPLKINDDDEDDEAEF